MDSAVLLLKKSEADIMNARTKILVSIALAFGAAAAQAQAINVETDYPANVMQAAPAGSGAPQDRELFLIQYNEGASELKTTIVDSSVDRALIRAQASEERPFDMSYFA